jgi:hypothetical protein
MRARKSGKHIIHAQNFRIFFPKIIFLNVQKFLILILRSLSSIWSLKAPLVHKPETSDLSKHTKLCGRQKSPAMLSDCFDSIQVKSAADTAT